MSNVSYHLLKPTSFRFLGVKKTQKAFLGIILYSKHFDTYSLSQPSTI